MEQLSKIADNIMALLLRQVLTWSLTAVLMIFFLPRHLGDEGLGKITFAIALVTILLVVTNLGTATFTVKQVALDRRRLSDLLWSAYALRLVLGVTVGVAVMFAVHLSTLSAVSKAVLSVFSVTLIVMGLDAAQVAALQGLEEMRRIALAEVANKSTVLVLAAAVLVSDHGVVAYALAVLMGACVGFSVNFSYLARRHLRRPSVRVAAIRYLVIGGLPFLMTGAITQLYGWTDAVILGFMTRDAVVGWLGAARQLIGSLNFVPLAVITAMLPALTRFHAQDRESMRVAVEKGMLAVLTTTVPLAAAFCLLSGDLIGFLRYPSEFQNSAPLLSLMAITLPVTGALMLIGTVVIAADRQKQWAITMALGLVANLALNVPLIALFDRAYANGAIGLALAAVISEAVLIVLGVRLLPAGVIGRPVLLAAVRSVGASLLMVAVMVATRAVIDPGFLPLLALGALVYFAALLALRGVTIGEIRFLLATFTYGRREREEPQPMESGAGLSIGTRVEEGGSVR